MKRQILIAGICACLAFTACSGNSNKGSADSTGTSTNSAEGAAASGGTDSTSKGTAQDTANTNRDSTTNKKPNTSPADSQH
jgi:hypothetical protein